MATPSTSRQPHIIDEEDKNSFRMIKMVYSMMPVILADIFLWGSTKPASESVEDYLLKRMSKKKYKDIFYKHEIRKMSSQDVGTFDVTHLFKIIKFGCQNLAAEHDAKWTTNDNNQLEWLLTFIKDQRNEMSHTFGLRKKLMLVKIDNIREQLERTLRVAGCLYGMDKKLIDQKVQEMKVAIVSIRDQPLEPSDIKQYKQDLLYRWLKCKLKTAGKKELRRTYKKWSQVNPAFFVQEEHLLLEVNSVFTRIVVENAGKQAKGFLVPYEQIITFCRNNTSAAAGSTSLYPEIFLIEGQGGVGKTTLTKYIMSQWSTGSDTIKGLSDFDLILFMECRSRKVTTFSDLLSYLFPKTNANHFKEGHLLSCALELKMLLILDGLDELNSSSELLFKDILQVQRTSDLVVVCTSRPEKVRYFYSHVPPEFEKAHLRVIGIPDDSKEEFLRRYHDEIKRKGKSSQKTEDLVDYLKNSPSCLQEHYMLPLNLVLLAWLWSHDSARVTNITSAVELYTELFNLVQKKLIDRLVHNEATQKLKEEELEQKIRIFLIALFHEALVSLRWDSIEKIIPSSLKTLIAVCKSNGLPPQETLPAFLVMKTVDKEDHASIPHKLAHDFYAAQSILSKLFDETTQEKNDRLFQDIATFIGSLNSTSSAVQNIISDAQKRLCPTTTAQRPGAIRAILSELHSDNPVSLQISKYRSVLVQLAGLLYIQKNHLVLECTAQEIIDLLGEAGMGKKDGSWGEDNDWYQVILNTKCNDTIIKHIAPRIQHWLRIDDGNIDASVKVLQDARPKKIDVTILGDPKNVPSLQDLLHVISRCGCKVDLHFHHDIRHPESAASHNPALHHLLQQ